MESDKQRNKRLRKEMEAAEKKVMQPVETKAVEQKKEVPVKTEAETKKEQLAASLAKICPQKSINTGFYVWAQARRQMTMKGWRPAGKNELVKIFDTVDAAKTWILENGYNMYDYTVERNFSIYHRFRNNGTGWFDPERHSRY
ncbi:Hypothetical protein POVN_LOCUS407 [uncultured virus]|nr:Hypothetical protein POVN_LOCUS407 [uncultured virus]